MKVIILFFLLGGILALTIWTWRINPSRQEYASMKRHNFTEHQLELIRRSTDLDQLRELATSQLFNFDEQVIERDNQVIKVQNLLALTVLLTIIAQIIIFLEIAARGRNRQQNA